MVNFSTSCDHFDNISSLISTDCIICPNGAHLIWKSPVYRFVIPHGIDSNNQRRYKEIFIDVTDSVPRFERPYDALRSVLDHTTQLLPKKNPIILDFGAGKLRNTIYLLEKGFDVCAVEFEQMYSKTDHAKKLYEEANSYGNRFHKLVFPHEFFRSQLQFDLVLLVNVCSIMPVPSERLLVIQYCREKLKENGYVLWYTMHNDNDYNKMCIDEVRIGDGYYMRATNRYQTFYRDFEPYEIDIMFLANGFRSEDQFTVSKSLARLYTKTRNNPTMNVLDAAKIRRFVTADNKLEQKKAVGVKILKEIDSPKYNIPNPDVLKEETIFINALGALETGAKNASAYHNLITAILIKLFMPPLRRYKIEKEFNEGQKRIDIVMSNTAENGFFKRLITHYGTPAACIVIECKNYEMEIGNEELDQLSGRFNEKRGMFGILTYRKTKNEDELLKMCSKKLERHEYHVPLSDEDIITMLNRKLADEDVFDILDDKMEALLSYLGS